MSRIAARGALRTILLTVPGLPAARAWQGRPFEPDPTAAFVRETLRLPGRTKRGIGRAGLIHQPFVYFVDLYYPATNPFRAVEVVTEAALATFYPGRRVLAVDVSGVVDQSGAEDVMSDARWHHAPVTIRGWYQTPPPTE